MQVLGLAVFSPISISLGHWPTSEVLYLTVNKCLFTSTVLLKTWMLKAQSEQNEAQAALTSTLQLLSMQIPRQHPLWLRLSSLPALSGWDLDAEWTTPNGQTVTCYKCTRNNNSSDNDAPKATRQPDMSQAHCTRWWEAHNALQRSPNNIGEEKLSLKSGMKCNRKEYETVTWVVPFLCLFCRQFQSRSTAPQLSSNIS